MSVSIASTCIPRSNARYSATVSATLGVMILSIAGSSAKLRNSTERLSAPDSSRLRLKYCASEYCTPIAAKTTAKSHLCQRLMLDVQSGLLGCCVPCQSLKILEAFDLLQV